MFRTILQLPTPDSLRGRVTALKAALSGGDPRLGDSESGIVAEVTNPTFSIVSGGLATVATALLVMLRGRALCDQTIGDDSCAPGG